MHEGAIDCQLEGKAQSGYDSAGAKRCPQHLRWLAVSAVERCLCGSAGKKDAEDSDRKRGKEASSRCIAAAELPASLCVQTVEHADEGKAVGKYERDGEDCQRMHMLGIPDALDSCRCRLGAAILKPGPGFTFIREAFEFLCRHCKVAHKGVICCLSTTRSCCSKG